MTAPTASALDGIVVVDLTDELAAYAGRLLADLGADVVRVESLATSTVREVAPVMVGTAGSWSAFDRFVNASKRATSIDPERSDDLERLAALVAGADVVIESSAPRLPELLGPEAVAAFERRGVRVIVTPYGLDHPRPWGGGDDLMVMAEGGLLHLGGYTDVGPVVAYGGQSRFAASIFAAVAALTGVIEREATGEGSTWDVSAQECIAQALEDSAATYSLTGRVRERLGERPREAGTGVYACRDGYVSMVAGRLGTAKAWTALVTWLNEAGADGAEALLEPQWERFEFRQSDDAVEAFGLIFEGFASRLDKADLYRGAQERMIALSPVSTVADLLDNEQLAFRRFFTTVDDVDFGGPLTFPRAPYSLSGTPVRDPRPAPGAADADATDPDLVREGNA